MAAARRARNLDGSLLVAPLLSPPSRSRTVRFLRARPLRSGARVHTGDAPHLSGIQSRDVAWLDAQHREFHPGGVGPSARPKHSGAGTARFHARGHRPPARRGEGVVLEARAPSYLPDRSVLRRLHEAAHRAQTALHDVLHEPRGLVHAPLLGSDVPARLRRAGLRGRVGRAL